MFIRAQRYWRVLEFPYTVTKLPPGHKLEILDISSPKLLACLIAKNYPHKVVAIDIWKEEIEFWQEVLTVAGNSRQTRGEILLRIEDATRLSFPDDSFDFVYSISVIEHIDGFGDKKAIDEIARVLKVGGTAVVTVPYDKEGYDVFRDESVYHKQYASLPVFYERWYNEEQLQGRLLGNSKLEVVDLQLIYEKHLRVHKCLIPTVRNHSRFVQNLWNLVEPVVGLLNLGITPGLGKAEGIAAITFRKR